VSCKPKRIRGPGIPTTRPALPSLAAAVAVALAAWAGTVDAAGLGRLSVISALGQPLQAEVEVTSVTPEEAATLTARLASPDAFRAAGLQFSNALAGLRMAVQERGGRHFIRVSSSNPMNEPFIDMMVELNWASGKFVREYTFLLDPPELRASRQTVEGGGAGSRVSPAVTAGAAAGAAAGAQPQPQPEPTADTPQARAAAVRARSQPQLAQQPVTGGRQAAGGTAGGTAGGARPGDRAGEPSGTGSDGATSGTVTVARGDSLGKIAAAKKPADATLEQTIIAIYQANRSAFIGNNPNLIREGRTLSIPDDAAIAAVDPALAQRQLRVAAQDFRTYKSRLAGAPTEVTAAGAGSTASGAVTAQVDDSAARQGAADRLELSKSTGAGGRQAGSLGSRDAEARIARDAAQAESSSRIGELERNVADLQKMLELKNRSLSDLQTQVEQLRSGGAPAAASMAAAAPPASPAAAGAPSPGAPVAADQAGTPSGVGGMRGGDPAPAGAAAMAPNAQSPNSQSPGTQGPGAQAPASQSPGTGTPAGQPAPSPSAAAASDPEASLFDELMDNPMILPALGGLALLIAFGLWMAMRRRKAARFEDSLVAADPYTANSLFGTTGSHHVDTGANSQSQITTMNEAALTEVDPIAEADVYIAYGREAQAEEILKEALSRQPDRQAIRLKLMEIHAGRKDAAAFEAAAREMYAMTGGHNEEWPRVAAMGLALDPENPLYAGGSPQAAAVNSSFGRAAAATSLAAASSAAVFARPPSGEVPPDGVHGSDPHPELHADLRADTDSDLQGDRRGDPQADLRPDLQADLRPDLHAYRPSELQADGQPEAGSTGHPVPGLDARQERGVPGSSEEVPDLDFKLDFDAPPQKAAAGLDDDFGQPMSFTQPASGPLSAMPSIDLPSLDLDLPPPSPPDRGRSAAGSDGGRGPLEDSRPRPGRDRDEGFEPEMDLSAIGLDLAPSSSLPAPSATSGPTSSPAGGANSGHWQEMASKLDLASAYGEIGDKEGARELLQEVVRGGDPSQQQKARELLATI
jgi:pilus assembly protein FimV